MASERRIEQISNLMKEELSKIVDKELDFPEGHLITITKVTISTDAYYATVFISVLGEKSKEILLLLGRSVYHIQQMLNRRLRMRPVPRIRFSIDEEEVRRETVEKSLAELEKEGNLS